jgi:hypothetical protein
MSGLRSNDAEKLERDARANANDFLTTPPLSDLRTTLDATSERDHAAVVDAALPLASDLSWLTSRVDLWLSQVAEDGSFQPPVFGIQDHGLDFDDTGLMLFLHPLMNISVASLFPRPRSGKYRGDLFFTGRPGLVAFAGAGRAVIRWWHCTRLDDNSDIARAVTIEPGEEERIDAATPPLVLDGAVDSFEFLEVEGSISLVRFAVRNGPCPISVRYNPATRTIAGLAPNTRNDARLIMGAAGVRQLGRQDRAEAIKAQLTHPSFFVRWQMMREYIAARGLGALAELEAFLAREHNPSVQRSAAATLQMLRAQAANAPKPASETANAS